MHNIYEFHFSPNNCLVLQMPCYITGYKKINFILFLIYFNTFVKSYGIPYYMNAICTACTRF